MQTADDQEFTYPGDQFLSRVRRSAVNVLGESVVGREVLELCDEHAEARRMIVQDRSRGLTVVAIVGATGQGKSWLVKQLIRKSDASSAVRSGNNLDEATEKLLWMGPFPPADMDSRYEQFLHCSSSDMEPIGVPYLLVDAPGSTDDRRSIAAVAQRALSLASVLLLVVRREQLRSQTVALTTEASEGTIVIPVVNAVREDTTLQADIDAFVARMRQAAPTSHIAAAVTVRDFDVQGNTELDVGVQAAEQIGKRLETELSNSWEGDRRRSTRLAALDARFRAALHNVLSGHLPELTSAVTRLNREARALPGEIAETLVGSSGSLRAAVRARLRLNLLTETAAFWFPYRSLLGLFNLTHGAWDRVFLSLSGSLPSLVSAVWTSSKNLAADRDAGADMQEGLRRRSAAAVADRLGPLATNFRYELAQLRNEPGRAEASLADSDSKQCVAALAGLDSLQEQSQRIFEEEVDRISLPWMGSIGCGIFGTLIFWVLMAGPILALYRGYFDASYATIREFAGDLSKFPQPDFAMLFTSLILSLLPTAIFSMVVISIAQSRRRVSAAEQAIRHRHHETISRLQRDGVLRLRWDEPLLSDAEFLLTAGNSDGNASGGQS